MGGKEVYCGQCEHYTLFIYKSEFCEEERYEQCMSIESTIINYRGQVSCDDPSILNKRNNCLNFKRGNQVDGEYTYEKDIEM